jgi:hypothetical protein
MERGKRGGGETEEIGGYCTKFITLFKQEVDIVVCGGNASNIRARA